MMKPMSQQSTIQCLLMHVCVCACTCVRACVWCRRSKLRMEDMREAQQALKEAQWADDKEVVSCRNCQKPFSVSRRKVCTSTDVSLLVGTAT